MMDLRSLNPQQRLAVETLHGPVMVLAGAGTGKTRVITHRIAHLIDRGTSPEHILAVTFTNKAAREMQQRIAGMLPRGGGDGETGAAKRPLICTFHSFCVRVLRQYADRLGYKRNFVIYDEADQIGVIRKILSRIHGPGSKADPAQVLAMLSRFRNNGQVRATADAQAAQEMAEHIRGRYESALRACNAVDFDDLILLVLRLFDDHADVLAECRRRYRQVMVDEYQDTNAAQFRLVHALTREHRNLCVVGDDDQSIYGWRGAEIANLLDLDRHYPEVRVIKLEQNYRSTSTILEAANALIRHNARRQSKRLWSQKGQGTRIVLQTYEHEEEEARAVADELEFARKVKRIPWAKHAVLFRTNIQSRPLETAFRQAGIRYHLVGGQSFFDRREVRDFLAYLKVLVNPQDDVSLLRIANVPARGLSDSTMERLLGLSHERKCSVYTVMRDAGAMLTLKGRATEAVAQFVDLLERTRARLAGGPGFTLGSWAEAFLRETGYVEDLRRSEKDPEAGENRVRNLLDLVGSLAGAKAGGTPMEQLGTFLEELMLDREREADEEAGEAVTLITMHSCKGLEFPRVFIVGLENGLLPHARSREEGTLDEERRLFYVAITRAMESLTLSHCGARKKYGKLTPCHPSMFLSELPEDLLEVGGSQRPVSREAGREWFASLRATLDEA